MHVYMYIPRYHRILALVRRSLDWNSICQVVHQSSCRERSGPFFAVHLRGGDRATTSLLVPVQSISGTVLWQLTGAVTVIVLRNILETTSGTLGYSSC